MKYYYALVIKALKDGTNHTTKIQFLAKRHRANSSDSWKYTVKIGYTEHLESIKNKPISFAFDGDWNDAMKHAFNLELGWMEDIKMEYLTEVTL